VINLAMERKLKTGEALDVNVVGKPHPTDPHVWILPNVVEGMDYCDAVDECWIWSIGCDKKTGTIMAARDCRFAHDRTCDLVWAR
jgi:hypothetical protein